MAAVQKAPRVLEVADMDNLLPRLQRCNQSLDIVEKGRLLHMPATRSAICVLQGWKPCLVEVRSGLVMGPSTSVCCYTFTCHMSYSGHDNLPFGALLQG